MFGDIRVPEPPTQLLRIGHTRTERGVDPSPLVVRHRIAAVAAPRESGHLVTGDAAETLDQPLQVEPSHGRLQDQRGRVIRVTGAVQHRDESAHRVAVHDRPGDAQAVAEGPHVVGADLERPVRGVVPGRATVIAQVQVDDLCHASQRREIRLEVGVVVTAWTTVQQHDRRPLSHHRTVWHHRGTVDIEPETSAVHLDLHPRSSPVVWSRQSEARPAFSVEMRGPRRDTGDRPTVMRAPPRRARSDTPEVSPAPRNHTTTLDGRDATRAS